MMDPNTVLASGMVPMEQMDAQPMPSRLSEATQDEDQEPPEAESNQVKSWTKKIKLAKSRWDDDFKRMRNNREFAYGFQWQDQVKLEDDRYINDFVVGAVNQKVATYYARNPKAVMQRRPRLDFELWDGTLESLVQAINSIGMARQVGMPDLGAMALLQDFNNGQMRAKQVEKIGKTLEILYQWMVDQQEPEFKKQMKALVRRVCTTGVGYVKLQFVRSPDTTVDSPLTVSDFSTRAKKLKAILEEFSEGEADETSPLVEEMKSTMAGMIYSMQSGEMMDVDEHLLITYPKASSIIPDRKCTNLKDFVDADWIAEERLLPLCFVNEYYETDIKPGGELVTYSDKGEEFTPKDALDGAPEDLPDKRLVCIWVVYDKRTKTTFTICNGHSGYIQRPEPVHPCTHRFWPIFALTFNDVDYEPGDKGSIFPPSDVQLMRSAQKEYNRSRQALRAHRKANAPRTAARAGSLDPSEKGNLRDADPHEVIDVKLPENQDIRYALMPVPTTPIDLKMYATDYLERDVELAAGLQQANIGPAQPNVTATVGSIAEQSRMTKASSNVDDLDDLLSDLAKASGEILLKEMSQRNVMRIVGAGAVWPDPSNREDFLNEIYLEVQAASSGRPNKGVEIANMRDLLPLLIQLGANPQFLVEEVIQRWDDRLDITRAFPLMPPQPSAGQLSQGQPPRGPGEGERGSQPKPARPGVDNKEPVESGPGMMQQRMPMMGPGGPA